MIPNSLNWHTTNTTWSIFPTHIPDSCYPAYLCKINSSLYAIFALLSLFLARIHVPEVFICVMMLCVWTVWLNAAQLQESYYGEQSGNNWIYCANLVLSLY